MRVQAKTGLNPMTTPEKFQRLAMAAKFMSEMPAPSADAPFFQSLIEGQIAADEDGFKSFSQAILLDRLNEEYGAVRLLFTTWKLKGGTTFLRTLAESTEAYDKGYIMNPSILAQMAPRLSPIQWDATINHALIHSGIDKRIAFVFVTPDVGFETFLDPFTRDAKTRDDSMTRQIGDPVPYSGIGNYPVKPGGNEILTLLDAGYQLNPNLTRLCQEPEFDMGFVLEPRPGACATSFFKDNATSFTFHHYKRLTQFMAELHQVGAFRGTIGFDTTRL